MRRESGTENIELAAQRAEEWLKEHKVEAEMVLEADHTMLAGGYARSLRLYLRSVLASPFSGKNWVKLMRWFVFVSVPPLRKAVFKI